MSLPESATQIVATLTLLQAGADSSDEGQDVDGTPIGGATALFAPAADHTVIDGVLISLVAITAYTDAAGILYNPGATIPLIDTDDDEDPDSPDPDWVATGDDIGVHLLAGIAWQVTISHDSMPNPITATIPADAVGTINLAGLVA